MGIEFSQTGQCCDKMEYLIRFIQTHETFRLAEIQALADLEKIDLAIVFYDPDVCATKAE